MSFPSFRLRHIVKKNEIIINRLYSVVFQLFVKYLKC